MLLQFFDQEGRGWLVPEVCQVLFHVIQLTDPLLDTGELLGDPAGAQTPSKLL
jgi:hypothetical protein